MGERTFDDFDEYATDYRSIHTENIKLSGVDSLYFAEMKVQLLTASEQDISLKILDVGCGDGATELFMQQYFPQWKVDGIDVSQKSIEIASGRKLPNAIFSVYNGSKTSFADKSFDVVFVAGVFHHINHDLHNILLKEICRVLKKGGRLYFFEHNPLNPVTKRLVRTCVFDKHARLLSSNYAMKLLQQNDLRVSKKEFIIFFPRKGFLSRFIFLEPYLGWLPLGGQYFIKAIK